MKVLLFTVHRTLNYGSVLQTYASKLIFDDLGIEMTVADYARPCDYNLDSVSSIRGYIRFRKETRAPHSFYERLKCLALALASYSQTRKFWMNCNAYLVSHVNLSLPLKNMDDIIAEASKYDALCSGSDQIWNSEYNQGTDKIYLLGFSSTNNLKLSLASSIGKDELTEDDIDLFTKYLPMFKGISVREKRAKNLLAKINIHAQQVLDPTLWIDKTRWEVETDPEIMNDRYVLLYKLKADERIDRIAEAVSKKLGLRIVRVCFSNIGRSRDKNIDNIVLPSVPKFLSLILHSDFVVTNSFHGTCFSINFNKQFISVSRNRFNSRIESILELLDLRSRFFSSESDMDRVDDLGEVDYGMVNRRLNEERIASFAWLQDLLKSKEKEESSNEKN